MITRTAKTVTLNVDEVKAILSKELGLPPESTKIDFHIVVETQPRDDFPVNVVRQITLVSENR